MALFHFSESADIEAFEPRPPLRHPEAEALVYAIDEWHSPLYYFPPDCPRVAFWRLPSTSEEDTTRWLTASDTRMVIAIEWSWLTTLSEQALYRYEFDGKGFEDCQDHGVHVSRTSVKPDAVTEVTNLPGRLAEACVELRFCPPSST